MRGWAVALSGLLLVGCVDLSSTRRDDSSMIPVDAEHNQTLDLLLNPEIDNPLFNNLAIPQEVPPQVNLPPEVLNDDQWKGSQCGVIKPIRAVFSKLDSWKIFWERAVAPYSHRFKHLPLIDFSKFSVVGVFMGEQRTPGYEIEILSARVENPDDPDQTMVVRYRQIRHPHGIFLPDFPVHPFHMIRVPPFKGKITFIETRKH